MARLAVACVVLLLAGCGAPEPPAPLWLAERAVVWCYATLAAPDCYRQPQPGAERRLIAAAPQVVFTPLGAAPPGLPPADE
jgi:hypothetical protein